VNGSARHFRVPALHLSKKDDLGESPGKRYSLMDIGLLTRSSLRGVQSKYLRDEEVGGTATRVFEITFRDDNSVRYVIWLDPRTHLASKREWYDGHQEMEQALVRLGRFVDTEEGTGKGRKYIDLAKFLLDSRRNGSQAGELNLALLLDGLAAEREQGITIDVAYRYFSTPKRQFLSLIHFSEPTRLLSTPYAVFCLK